MARSKTILKRAAGARASTGIPGFDEITYGGLPAGKVTIAVGGPGCGKTLFALQWLAAGARDFAEPGLFVSFEERAADVFANANGFGWKLAALHGKTIDTVDAQLAPAVALAGEFDLLGMLAILRAKAKAIRAKRIVIDGIDVLLSMLRDPVLVRQELLRLRDWLREMRLSAIITAKARSLVEGSVADDFLQYMSDCVVTLHQRTIDGTALRFIAVPKFRGSSHSANEYAFSIGETGLEVAAGSQSELRHPAFSARVSTGVARLDAMLEGGYYRGSSTLITGAPGTAKTTLVAAFAESAGRRRERTLFVSFDEAPQEIMRNVASVGIDLAARIDAGIVRMVSLRSRGASPETHVARIRALVRQHRAKNLVVDRLSALARNQADHVAEDAAIQIIDLAKSQGITIVTTSLLGGKLGHVEDSPIGISTIADTWMHLTYANQGGERNRALTIIKARGTQNSNQVRELVLSKSGVTLSDVYSAGGEVYMGTLRWERENAERHRRDAARRDAERQESEGELARIKAAHAEAAADARRETSQLLSRRRADVQKPKRERGGGER